MASSFNNNDSSQLPDVKITTTDSARDKLDSLLQQEAEFSFISPLPSPSVRDDQIDQNIQQNNQQPALPPPAHTLVEPKYTSEEIPNYENTVVDMPPSYPASFKSEKPEGIIFAPSPLTSQSLGEAGETYEPWPVTKILFFFGFLLWPLWFAGMGFSMFAKDAKTRLWGRRCIWNSLIVIIVFIYIVIAYIRSDGKLIS